MSTTDLERELARLADGIDAPAVPVSADVARGRRRLVHSRLAVAGAALATAAVVAATAMLGQGTPTSTPQPIDRTPDDERSGVAEPAEPTRALPPIDDPTENGAVLTQWNEVLAEHLDPERQHLRPYLSETANEQSGAGYLGSKYGWASPGEDGLGMLQIGVAARPGALGGWSPCRTGQLTCRDTTGPGGEPARVGTLDSVTTVELEQADGDAVVLTLDLLFGNNSSVPLSGTDVSVEQLLEAAADARLDLPEPPPSSSIDPEEFQRALGDLAGGGHEVVGFPAGDQSLLEGALFVGQRQVAVLTADAFPTTAGYGLPGGCDRKQFLRCERREVAGSTVFLGWVDEKYFPGVQVVAAGPRNVVRVEWQRSGRGGAAPDVDGLVDLVTDPRWQT